VFRSKGVETSKLRSRLLERNWRPLRRRSLPSREVPVNLAEVTVDSVEDPAGVPVDRRVTRRVTKRLRLSVLTWKQFANAWKHGEVRIVFNEVGRQRSSFT
jgi:hypothetical protein